MSLGAARTVSSSELFQDWFWVRRVSFYKRSPGRGLLAFSDRILDVARHARVFLLRLLLVLTWHKPRDGGRGAPGLGHWRLLLPSLGAKACHFFGKVGAHRNLLSINSGLAPREVAELLR